MFDYCNPESCTKEMRVQIATRLHNERVNYGLTLEQLADKIDYSKPTVHSWEKGWQKKTGENKIPTLDQLLVLSTLYHCTPEYLLCEYDGKSRERTDISQMIGLTEASISKLHSIFSYELAHPSERYAFTAPTNYSPASVNLDSTWRVDLFAFLNYFIQNIESFGSLLSDRRPIELLIKNYNRLDPDVQNDILNGFHQLQDCYPPRSLEMNILDKLVMSQKLLSYYASLGYSIEKSNKLTNLCIQYFFVLSPQQMKRSDFEISEIFIDIVKSFYNTFDTEIETYRDFIEQYQDPNATSQLKIICPPQHKD